MGDSSFFTKIIKIRENPSSTVKKHSITEKIPSGFCATKAELPTIKPIKRCYLALGMA
jgi:hypothetical protein